MDIVIARFNNETWPRAELISDEQRGTIIRFGGHEWVIRAVTRDVIMTDLASDGIVFSIFTAKWDEWQARHG